MNEKNVVLELSYNELEVMKETMIESISELRRNLRKVDEGNLSVVECGEFDSESDAEFYLDLQAKVEKKVTSIQEDQGRNDVRFIQQENVFRIEERIKVYQVRSSDMDKLAFIHETRHGVHFLYSDLESLIKSYNEGKESKLYFGCEKEAEFHLLYWKG